MAKRPPGRPRAQNALRRGPSLHIRLPVEELAQATKAAATKGLSLSAYVRALLKGG